MDQARRLFAEIDQHLTEDDRPSPYLRTRLERGALDTHPFQILSILAKTEQNRKYHPEGDVFTHTLLTVDQAAKRRKESQNPRALLWAALLHDVGKPHTTKMRRGALTAYNHDIAGEKIARQFLETLTDEQPFINQVTALVRWHMHPFFAGHNKGWRPSADMLRDTDYRELTLLSLCDRLGRYGIDEQAGHAAVAQFVRKVEHL